MDLISSEQRHLLSIGRVPLLRKRSVLRHKLLDKLGERIEKFCDNSGKYLNKSEPPYKIHPILEHLHLGYFIEF